MFKKLFSLMIVCAILVTPVLAVVLVPAVDDVTATIQANGMHRKQY